jgi:hypothetical protein
MTTILASNFCHTSNIFPSSASKSFPIPGKYHYRYLKTVGNMTVWMDASDDNQAVPPFDGKIFIKASRISEIPQRQSAEPVSLPKQQQPQQQHQQVQSRTSSAAGRISIPKPPNASETLLAFGSDDINEDAQPSHHVTSGSFMDSNNDDLIGLGIDSSSNLPKVTLGVYVPSLLVHMNENILFHEF